MNRFAKYLGSMLGAYACVTDPEIIVIGGGVSKAGEPLIDIVTRYYKEYAFSSVQEHADRTGKTGQRRGHLRVREAGPDQIMI